MQQINLTKLLTDCLRFRSNNEITKFPKKILKERVAQNSTVYN